MFVFVISHMCIDRSSHLQMFFKISVLKNFAIFTGTKLCWSLYLITLIAEACNFIKKRRQHRCFPVNIAKFSGTTFFIKLLRWLLLYWLNIHTEVNNLHSWNEQSCAPLPCQSKQKRRDCFDFLTVIFKHVF